MNSKPMRAARGSVRCYFCKENTNIRQGDWFVPHSTPQRQVFCCRSCEPSIRSDHKAAVTQR